MADIGKEVTLADVLPGMLEDMTAVLKLIEKIKKAIRRRGGTGKCFDDFVGDPDHRLVDQLAKILVEAEARKRIKANLKRLRR